MALVNIIHAANYIYSNKDKHGRVDPLLRPKCYNWLFPFHGEGGIGAIPNGFGKSGLVDACYLILSKDKTLFRNTKARMSPKDKTPSHIRIEFLLPRHNAAQYKLQGTLVGNSAKHVLGIVGHKDPGSKVVFYSYRGTLKDVPLYKGNTKEFLSMNEYLEHLERVKAHTSINLENPEDWYERVVLKELNIPADIVQQLVKYQKKGGDDKAATLFQTTRMKGVNSLQAAFFYQTIVPEIFRNVVRETGTPDGDNINLSLREGLERFGNEHRSMVEATLRATRNLDDLTQDSNHVESLVKKFCRKEGLQNMANIVESRIFDLHLAFKTLYSERLIPGIPAWVPSGDPNIDILTQHMVYDRKEGLLLSLGGLEKLLGVDSGRIQDPTRIKIKTSKITQDTDFIPVYPNFSTVLPDYRRRGSVISKEECVTVFRHRRVVKSILKYFEKEEIASLIERAFDFAERSIINDPARVALQNALNAYESWTKTFTQKIEATRQKQINQKSVAENEIEKILTSPTKKKLQDVNENLGELRKRATGFTPEGSQSYEKVTISLSDYGAIPSLIDSAIKKENDTFNRRLSRNKNWLEKHENIFITLKYVENEAATIKISQNDFFNERLKNIEKLSLELGYHQRELSLVKRRISAIDKGDFYVPQEIEEALNTAKGINFKYIAKWGPEKFKGQTLHKCFTLFSNFLHCPVCSDYEEAKKLAKCVAQSRALSIPVFWEEGIKEALQKSSIQDDGCVVFSSPLLGIETVQVKSLIDPERISKDRMNLDAQKKKLNEQIETLGKKLEQAEKINGQKIQDLLDKQELINSFPKVKQIYHQTNVKYEELKNFIAPFLDDLTRAIVHEQALRKNKLNQAQIIDLFNDINVAENKQIRLTQKLSNEKAELEDKLSPLKKEMKKRDKILQAINDYQTKKLTTRISKEKEKTLQAKERYTQYFKTLQHIYNEYLRIKKKAKSTDMDAESYPEPTKQELTSKVVYSIKERRIDALVQNGELESATQNINAVVRLCREYHDSSIFCMEKAGEFGRKRTPRQRGDNLHTILHRLQGDIDNAWEEIENKKKDLEILISDKFPKETLEKINLAVEGNFFAKLNREFKILKKVLATKKRESNKSEQFELESRKELIEHLAFFASEGIKNLKHFQAICNASNDHTLVVKGGTVHAEERRKEIVEGVIDSFEGQAKDPENAPSTEDLYIDFLKATFREPTVEIKHSAIHTSGREFSLDANVSTGEGTAVGLLILTKLKEFASARSDKFNTTEQGDFVVIDGIFSNCSRNTLWEGSLKALTTSSGSFQLIGFLHDVSFINNFDIFPSTFYGKPQGETLDSVENWASILPIKNEKDLLFAKAILKNPKNRTEVQ